MEAGLAGQWRIGCCRGDLPEQGRWCEEFGGKTQIRLPGMVTVQGVGRVNGSGPVRKRKRILEFD
jgi:hypothetical protein